LVVAATTWMVAATIVVAATKKTPTIIVTHYLVKKWKKKNFCKYSCHFFLIDQKINPKIPYQINTNFGKRCVSLFFPTAEIIKSDNVVRKNVDINLNQMFHLFCCSLNWQKSRKSAKNVFIHTYVII